MRLKYKIIEWLVKPFRGQKTHQPFFHQLMLTAIRGMNYYIEDIANSGELEVIKYVSSKTEDVDTPVLFDVGANTGEYSGCLLNAFGSKCNLYAFEPSATTFKTLEGKLSRRDNMELVNAGLGDKQETVTLYQDEKGSSFASIYPENTNEGSRSSEQVTVTTLDTFCQKSNVERIHFLKLDVEGHELAVLKGAKEMLGNKKITFIQFEYGHNMASHTYFKDFYDLLSTNYKLYRVVKDGLTPITEYRSELHEVIASVNFFAELK